MSDISGPPQTRDTSNSVRSAEKLKAVSKDPDEARTTPQHQGNNQPQSQSKEAYGGRDPAVSIAASTALLREGQEITGAIAKLDVEGRPILETNTVTVALRPDAGLKSTDTVTLKITDTGKELAADLVKRNGSPEVSPQRVTLTVISIKGAGTPNIPTPGSTVQDGPSYAPVRPLPVGVSADDEIKLALLLKSNSAGATNSQLERTSPITPATKPSPSVSANSASTTVLAQTTSEAVKILKPQTPTSGIAITAPNAGPSVLSGLGAPITAATLEGRTITLQPLDLAVSNVPPREIAVVERIAPLSALEAKTLSIPATLLTTPKSNLAGAAQNTDLSLVKLETSKGTYVAPAQFTTHLSGESVRVTEGSLAASVGTQNTLHTATQHRALWVEDRAGALPQKVSVEFTNQTQNSGTPERAITSATITAVQTVSAFMGASGASTDLRLQTTQGDISLTLPSATRPTVGDTVHIMAENRTDGPPLPTPAAAATSVAATGAESAQASGHATAHAAAAAGMLTNWPAFEEAVAALAAANPEAASALAEKSAQGGAKLTNSLLFFLKAAGRAPTSEAWIGDKATAALETTSRSLLEQLRTDVRQMARMAAEPVGEWRPIIVPFEARLGDFPLVAFLIQNQHHKDDENQSGTHMDDKDDDEQRFIVQVAFSVLGDIQLDGRIQQHQFDLTVRSKQAFSKELTRDTRLLFDQALAANGFSGGLRFEETDIFPVDAATVANDQLMAAAGQRP